MLLDSVLDENAIIVENVVDATDALTECLIGVEQAHGEMMLEQAKDEFKQFVNEGSIEPISEGVIDSIKNFFKKLWNFIKKYWNKLKNWVTGLNKNAYQYYQVNEAKIKTGINSVTKFYGYTGLKDFSNIAGLNNRINAAVAKHIGFTGIAGTSIDSNYSSDYDGYLKSAEKADKSNASIKTKEATDNALRTALGDFKKAIVGSNSSSTEESFVTILKDDIRGGNKEVTMKYSFDELKKVLSNEAAVKNLASSIKMQENVTKKLENEAFKYSHMEDSNKNSGRAANFCTQLAKLTTTACNAADSMIAEVVKQADRFAHMAVSGKSDSERKNEDAEFADIDDAKAYLESIGLA